MNTIKQSNGLTLIETLIAVTLTTTLIMMTVYWIIERNKMEQATVYGKDIASIIAGFDKRLHIDGFDINNFKNGKQWSGNNFFTFLESELVAKDSSCGKPNGWIPTPENEKKSQLIPCSLWTKVPYDMTVKAQIIADAEGFVERFELVFSGDNFNELFKYINKMKLSAAVSDPPNITGGHNYYFANKNAPEVKLTTAQCIKTIASCAFIASFNREGGSEYLRVDGSNSMIGSSISFKESKNSNTQQCLKWSQKDASSPWTSQSVNCGIGVYKQTGFPISVDVAAGNSTQKRVMLDKECNVYQASGNTVETTSTSPCGIGRVGSGSEIYQVVDQTSAKVGYVQTLYASTIVANQTNTQYMQIYRDLTVDGDSYLKSRLTVTGNITAQSNISAAGAITSAKDITSTTGNIVSSKGNINAYQGTVNATNGSFSNEVNASKNINSYGGNINALKGNIQAINAGFSGEANANGNINSYNGNLNALNGSVNAVNGGFSNELNAQNNINSYGGNINALKGNMTAIDSTFTGKMGVGQTINAGGRISTGEYLYIGSAVSEGVGCSPAGLVGRTNNGTLVSCTNGVWRSAAPNSGGTYQTFHHDWDAHYLGCRVANTKTGTCGCPSGFTPTQTSWGWNPANYNYVAGWNCVQ